MRFERDKGTRAYEDEMYRFVEGEIEEDSRVYAIDPFFTYDEADGKLIMAFPYKLVPESDWHDFKTGKIWKYRFYCTKCKLTFSDLRDNELRCVECGATETVKKTEKVRKRWRLDKPKGISTKKEYRIQVYVLNQPRVLIGPVGDHADYARAYAYLREIGLLRKKQ